jgi:hypothetical protein
MSIIPDVDLITAFRKVCEDLTVIFSINLSFSSVIVNTWTSSILNMLFSMYTPVRPVMVMHDPLGCFLEPIDAQPGFDLSALEP